MRICVYNLRYVIVCLFLWIAIANFHNDFLFDFHFCAVINKNNPLSKKVISISDLNGQVIAGRGFEYDCFAHMMRLCNKCGAKPIVRFESNNERLLIKAAEHNLAIAFVIKEIAEQNINEATEICEFDWTGEENQVYLSYKKSRALSNEAKLFRKELLKWIERRK